jgi:hypothetical protein
MVSWRAARHSSGVSSAPPGDAPMCPEVEPASRRAPPDASCVSGHTLGRRRRRPVPAERFGDRAGYEASSNQSSACGGSRAGVKIAGVHGGPSSASTAHAMARCRCRPCSRTRRGASQRRHDACSSDLADDVVFRGRRRGCRRCRPPRRKKLRAMVETAAGRRLSREKASATYGLRGAAGVDRPMRASDAKRMDSTSIIAYFGAAFNNSTEDDHEEW